MRGLPVRPRMLAYSVCALLASATTTTASTVVPMNMKTLADYAGQVLIGTVRSVRAEPSAEGGGIESLVELAHVVYLKGTPSPTAPGSHETFTLTVPGGTLGDRSMRVCCAPEFGVGERRLLFLLPTYKTFPTVGLWQGSFLVVRDTEGIDRVYQEGMIPVTKIGADWFPETHGCPSSKVTEQVVGERGVRLVRRGVHCTTAPAMSLEEFLAAVRPILDASHDHHLTRPAGRRVPADLSAVPLVPAGGKPTRPAERPTATTAPAAATGDEQQ